jgi:hypothetical protein
VSPCAYKRFGMTSVKQASAYCDACPRLTTQVARAELQREAAAQLADEACRVSKSDLAREYDKCHALPIVTRVHVPQATALRDPGTKREQRLRQKRHARKQTKMVQRFRARNEALAEELALKKEVQKRQAAAEVRAQHTHRPVIIGLGRIISEVEIRNRLVNLV